VKVAVVGAGTLGRRIAAVHAAGGDEVRLYDVSSEQSRAAAGPGVEACDDLATALRDAWLVIEAVPEKLELKREVFRELDRLAPAEAILGSNSSSIPSSRLVDGLAHPGRVLNVHYQFPPEHRAVELMSCGQTDPRIIDELMEALPRYGLVPFRVRRESDGFIFNRVWAAIKRECLSVVAEGVATPEEVDRMWELFASTGIPPFRLMDQIGLQVVLDIEEHYASVRDGLSEAPRALLREYIAEGRRFYE
jgi:3-hydroxybutyryl-CoA dehydrogenase